MASHLGIGRLRTSQACYHRRVDDYISAPEAAEMLRVSARQVNRYGQAGRIQTQRIGRRVLYLRTDVD